ncbi:Ubiquitin-conjugating enzyme [Quillaja saponaria]|uniref:Ubiquitin-conjugating enzyme n=1 Tax=Quillaja saponaria TaxID=32244 RepID=A0AAD7PU15_QUISA|nr:Ubiquitin-conjugating enzyme [Quillaja saponaria]
MITDGGSFPQHDNFREDNDSTTNASNISSSDNGALTISLPIHTNVNFESNESNKIGEVSYKKNNIPYIYQQDVRSNANGMTGIGTELAGDGDSDSSITDDEENEVGADTEGGNDSNSDANRNSDVNVDGDPTGQVGVVVDVNIAADLLAPDGSIIKDVSSKDLKRVRDFIVDNSGGHEFVAEQHVVEKTSHEGNDPCETRCVGVVEKYRCQGADSLCEQDEPNEAKRDTSGAETCMDFSDISSVGNITGLKNGDIEAKWVDGMDFEVLVEEHFKRRGYCILKACDAYMKSCLIGSLTKDATMSGKSNQNSNSVGFKLMLAKIAPKLFSVLTEVGADCHEFKHLQQPASISRVINPIFV